jgi:cell division protein FtsW (lipid II flippase)
VTRRAESVLLGSSAALAAFGVALVELSQGQHISAEVGLTFFVFVAAFGGVHLAIRSWANLAGTALLPLASILTATGFVEIYRLDPDLASRQRWWLLISAILASGLLFGLKKSGTDLVRRYRYLILVSAVVLLLLPLLPTTGEFPIRGRLVNGSRLWVLLDLDFFSIQFQPGEIVKLLIVGFLASFLAERRVALAMMTRRIGRWNVPEPRQLLPVVIAWLLSFVVLVYQRDLGASLLLFATFVAMLYMATGRVAYLGVGAGFFAVGGTIAWRTFSHVQSRMEAWLAPFDHYDTTGYQIAQGLFAMGSGSLSGSGIGLGRPDLIPFASTDFIFAAVVEELGLAGSVVIMSVYALLVAVSFGIALRSRDIFRKLFAAGLAFTLGLQAFLILAGVLRLLPLTGITLPFMSYGGSSLISNFLLVAMLARISHEEKV